MHFSKTGATVAVVLGIALLLASCSSEESPAPSASPTPAICTMMSSYQEDITKTIDELRPELTGTNEKKAEAADEQVFSEMKKQTKKISENLPEGTPAEVQRAFKELVAAMDKGVEKGEAQAESANKIIADYLLKECPQMFPSPPAPQTSPRE